MSGVAQEKAHKLGISHLILGKSISPLLARQRGKPKLPVLCYPALSRTETNARLIRDRAESSLFGQVRFE